MTASVASGKESAFSAGDLGSIPGLGGAPGLGNGNLLPYICMKSPTDRGALQTTVQRVAESDTTEQRSIAHSFGNATQGTTFCRNL